MAHMRAANDIILDNVVADQQQLTEIKEELMEQLEFSPRSNRIVINEITTNIIKCSVQLKRLENIKLQLAQSTSSDEISNCHALYEEARPEIEPLLELKVPENENLNSPAISYEFFKPKPEADVKQEKSLFTQLRNKLCGPRRK